MRSDLKGNKRKRTVGFAFAVRGWKHAWKERNLRIQVGVAAAALVLGAFFRITAIEWLILVIVIGMVIAMEMINTAVERLLDYVAPEFHPKAGAIKDIAAGSVLAVAVAAAVVGTIIFLPRIAQLF
ncbi:diacylglycerol kinase [Sediminibacillus dalangtanensis]|uniref:Diacylglycerol kinase n=1 Tax=Sediminibacillus dalangtanensis TaxID=2729421 RepID=A0ABX7VSD7_9BACI|nr:diacylglycerol kinase [Sediminibacillus dalangtanensis]QTM99862.1 diacylglycerol kinase [Sediminibacillus dalangtanensis]